MLNMKTDQDHTHNTTTTRRHFTAQDKIKLLRLHLLEGRPISEICDEHGLAPSNFYNWQKTFFENGAAAFERDRAPRPRGSGSDQQRVAQLEARLKRKEEVIAMLSEDLLNTKKELGEA
jgi:transposase